MNGSGTMCPWVIHDSKAVQHFHSCLHVPQAPGSIKNLGPVVQSIVSLTSSLRVISLTV